ncbi:MAG: hypothetical protein WBG86_16435 [Polyangiales bacterium]
MRINAFVFLALSSAGLLVLGCGDDSGNGDCPDGEILCDGECIEACGVSEVECDCVCIPEFEPTLADIQTNVFDVSCAASSCHDSQAPAADLNLSSVEASETNLIDVDSVQVDKVRVAPGDLEASYLFDKLTNTDIAADTTPMPQGGFPLCDAKLLSVEAWIAEGAN